MFSSQSSSHTTKDITVTCGTQNGGSFTMTIDGNNMDCSGCNNGVCLMVFDMKDFKNPTTKKCFESSQMSTLCSTIEKVRDGSLIVMGTKGDCTKCITEDMKSCIALLGSMEISRMENRDCWAMMVKKGMPQTFYEMRKPETVTFNRTFDCSC